MTDVQGLIYAYETESALGELTTHRTSASLPVGGRYRLIDFILSNMVSAGMRDVGVIMPHTSKPSARNASRSLARSSDGTLSRCR